MLKDKIKKQVLFIVFSAFCLAYCIWICMNYLYLSHSIKRQVFVIFLPLYVLLIVLHEDRYYFILSLLILIDEYTVPELSSCGVASMICHPP